MQKIAVILFLLGVFTVGCVNQEKSPPVSGENVLESKIIEIENELKETKRQLDEAIKELSIRKKQISENEKSMNSLEMLKKRIEGITNLDPLKYEIILNEAREKVIFFKFVPEGNNDEIIYLLKAAVQFTGKEAKKISFWSNKSDAVTYVKGDYDKESWSGYDSMFGLIENDQLLYFYSRDDVEYLNFGRFIPQ